MTKAKKTPVESATATTRCRETCAKGELKRIMEPRIKDTTPRAVSMPWVGAFTSAMSRMKARATKTRPVQFTESTPREKSARTRQMAPTTPDKEPPGCENSKTRALHPQCWQGEAT